MKNTESLRKQLESKKNRLNEVLNTQFPKNPYLWGCHYRKLENAPIFIEELTDIICFLEIEPNIKLVTLPTLKKQCEKADFASVEFDGEFCKLVLIQNFPYDDLWLLYVAPVESI